MLQFDFGKRFCICMAAWEISYEKRELTRQKGIVATYETVDFFKEIDFLLGVWLLSPLGNPLNILIDFRKTAWKPLKNLFVQK